MALSGKSEWNSSSAVVKYPNEEGKAEMTEEISMVISEYQEPGLQEFQNNRHQNLTEGHMTQHRKDGWLSSNSHSPLFLFSNNYISN